MRVIGAYGTPFVPDGTICPGCGSRETWVQDDEGDYYDGPTYLCVACGSDGHAWYAREIGPNSHHYATLVAIRKYLSGEPVVGGEGQ